MPFLLHRYRAPVTRALAALLLAGCAAYGPERPSEYVVVRGDTLYAIAWRFGIERNDLVRWNGITNPDRILVGQRLALVPPETGAPAMRNAGPVVVAAEARDSPRSTPVRSARVPRRTTAGVAAARPVAARASADDGDDSLARGPWRWPVRGELLRRYDADGPGRKGIEIGAGLGQTVSAAQGGEVVYSGSGLPGYGRLIIIKHSESMLSAYGFLGKILLNEGDKVRAGQAIGEVGTSSENRPALHFEIRQNGRPVDPLRYLPG